MSLSPQFLDELRARTLLSSLVGKAVKLQKAGREYRACCPFHNEKSPSFYVNDEKSFYHCFGCGAHGDAIRWMTEHQGLPFMDAVKELAALAGLDVPAADPRQRAQAERRDSLHDVMADAARWFEEQLAGPGGEAARAYLIKRGISDTQRRDFALGFAPDGRTRLKAALAQYPEAMLVEAGLLIAMDGRDSYDRFRNRLMIPIRDQRGRVIAFGGRIMGDGEPKYLNSPETPLFDKGRTLFNIDRAGPAARRSDRVIVVEGYMDAIALDRAGIGEAVAPLGTALTEAQLERLWRMTPLPYLCFDGDAAGQKAAMRAAIRALPMIAPGRSLQFVTLPPGQDPDDLLRSAGRTAFEACLQKAEPLVDRIWNHELAAEPLTTPEARAGLRRRLADITATIGDPHVRDQYAIEFQERFNALYGKQRDQGRRAFTPRRFERARNDRGGAGGRGRPRWLPPENPPGAFARAIGGDGVEPLYIRAVICGLARFPQLIASHAEAVGNLPIADPLLDQIRTVMVRAAFGRQELEPSTLQTILRDAGLESSLDVILGTNGLAFSFLRSNADPERAKRDLSVVINAIASRPELDAALAAVTERLKVAADEAAFAEQRRLRIAREEADNALAALTEGDQV